MSSLSFILFYSYKILVPTLTVQVPVVITALNLTLPVLISTKNSIPAVELPKSVVDVSVYETVLPSQTHITIPARYAGEPVLDTT